MPASCPGLRIRPRMRHSCGVGEGLAMAPRKSPGEDSQRRASPLTGRFAGEVSPVRPNGTGCRRERPGEIAGRQGPGGALAFDDPRPQATASRSNALRRCYPSVFRRSDDPKVRTAWADAHAAAPYACNSVILPIDRWPFPRKRSCPVEMRGTVAILPRKRNQRLTSLGVDT